MSHFTCWFPAVTFRGFSGTTFFKEYIYLWHPLSIVWTCFEVLAAPWGGVSLEKLSESGVISKVPGIPAAADHLCRSLCESCHTSAVSFCPNELTKSHQDKARKDKAEVLCGGFECEFSSLLTKQEQNQSDTTQVYTA